MWFLVSLDRGHDEFSDYLEAFTPSHKELNPKAERSNIFYVCFYTAYEYGYINEWYTASPWLLGIQQNIYWL